MMQRFLRFLKGTKRFVGNRMGAGEAKSFPHVSVTRNDRMIEISTDDLKLGMRLYREVRKKRASRLITFKVEREKTGRGGGDSLIIRMPRNPERCDDFIYAEFSSRFHDALGRPDYE